MTSSRVRTLRFFVADADRPSADSLARRRVRAAVSDAEEVPRLHELHGEFSLSLPPPPLRRNAFYFLNYFTYHLLKPTLFPKKKRFRCDVRVFCCCMHLDKGNNEVIFAARDERFAPRHSDGPGRVRSSARHACHAQFHAPRIARRCVLFLRVSPAVPLRALLLVCFVRFSRQVASSCFPAGGWCVRSVQSGATPHRSRAPASVAHRAPHINVTGAQRFRQAVECADACGRNHVHHSL